MDPRDDKGLHAVLENEHLLKNIQQALRPESSLSLTDLVREKSQVACCQLGWQFETPFHYLALLLNEKRFTKNFVPDLGRCHLRYRLQPTVGAPPQFRNLPLEIFNYLNLEYIHKRLQIEQLINILVLGNVKVAKNLWLDLQIEKVVVLVELLDVAWWYEEVQRTIQNQVLVNVLPDAFVEEVIIRSIMIWTWFNWTLLCGYHQQVFQATLDELFHYVAEEVFDWDIFFIL